MAIYYYTHNSPGAPSAPTFAGAGTMIALLDYCLVTGMGWTKVFSGTNIATYRAPTGNRMYLGVDDTSTAGFTRIRGFETATAAGVAAASGTNPFPSDAQVSGGLYLMRAYNASYPASNWLFVSDGKMFYLSTGTYSSGSVVWLAPMLMFGDFTAYNASDNTYNTCIFADNTTNNPSGMGIYTTGTTTSMLYFPRSYTGTGTSIAGATLGNPYRAGSSSGYIAGRYGGRFPNPVTGTLDLSYMEVGQAAGARGRLPGLWYPLHGRPLSRDDTYVGQGPLAGKTFKVRDNSTADIGQLFFEISDTWGT